MFEDYVNFVVSLSSLPKNSRDWGHTSEEKKIVRKQGSCEG